MFMLISSHICARNKLINPVCRRLFSTITGKPIFSSPLSSLLRVQLRSKLVDYSPRCVQTVSTSTGYVASSKKEPPSKRGPKFRTPSKLKDASAALGVTEACDDEKDRLPDWNIWAYATADEYQMDRLSRSLREEKDYELSTLAKDLPDVFRLTPLERKDTEFDRREIFVFSDGAVVFWDVPNEERAQFLFNLRPFERRPFDAAVIEEECERLVYVLREYEEEERGEVGAGDQGNKEQRTGIRSGRFRKEALHLDASGKDSQQQLLERYTVSNVMSASVQLAMWESDLECLASSLEEVTQAMNEGRISLHKKSAISYAGRLISLRHNVSLHSDLLDHPDFYWERVGLEKLYDQASEILCLRRRVNVFNKKLDDAMALINLIMQELAVSHSSRLEWLIIYLICIEVLFDAYHFYRIW